MEDNKREIWGSSFTLWYGKLLGKISKYFNQRSDKLITKGSKTIVANPTCKFISPFLLVFNFTVNNTDKYQLVHEGNFKTQYKERKKVLDEYEDKVSEFEEQRRVYDNLKDKKGAIAPTPVARIAENPLEMKEMFLIILPAHRAWYKKV